MWEEISYKDASHPKYKRKLAHPLLDIGLDNIALKWALGVATHCHHYYALFCFRRSLFKDIIHHKIFSAQSCECVYQK